MTDSLTEMELLEWRQESKADEREIIAVIRELQHRHQQELEPYFRQLAALRSSKPITLVLDKIWVEEHLIKMSAKP